MYQGLFQSWCLPATERVGKTTRLNERLLILQIAAQHRKHCHEMPSPSLAVLYLSGLFCEVMMVRFKNVYLYMLWIMHLD